MNFSPYFKAKSYIFPKNMQKSVANQKKNELYSSSLIEKTQVPAQVAEQVDAQDLKSCEI